MITLNIPQGLVKEGFVVLPRREYEGLLRAKQGNDIVINNLKEVSISQEDGVVTLTGKQSLPK